MIVRQSENHQSLEDSCANIHIWSDCLPSHQAKGGKQVDKAFYLFRNSKLGHMRGSLIVSLSSLMTKAE